MNEPTLFPQPLPDGRLTERQAFVLAELRRHPAEGLDADEAGALLHERRGSHDAGVRCRWCAADGRGVLKALRKKGLVRARRGGTWVALTEGGEEPSKENGGSGAPLSASARRHEEDIPY